MKFFNSSLAEDHPENTYMEREWRAHGVVEFKKSNIHRIIMPKQFVERCKEDIPDYNGQISFAPELKSGIEEKRTSDISQNI
jgi:hypothetical protein